MLSLYGRENYYNFIQKQFNDWKMLYANKNEATLIEQPLSKQFSDHLFNSDFTNNIAEYKHIVNKQYASQSKINARVKEKFEKALNSKKKPGVTVIADKMTKSQKAETDIIGEYAKSIGRKVIIVDDTAQLGYAAANEIHGNGKIVLALNNTGVVMSVFWARAFQRHKADCP